MKYLLLLILFAASCSKPVVKTITIHDTIPCPEPALVSRIDTFLQTSYITERSKDDSILITILKRQNDTLKGRLYDSTFKLKNIRFYANIAYKNPSQRQFLAGWIIRALKN